VHAQPHRRAPLRRLRPVHRAHRHLTQVWWPGESNGGLGISDERERRGARRGITRHRLNCGGVCLVPFWASRFVRGPAAVGFAERVMAFEQTRCRCSDLCGSPQVGDNCLIQISCTYLQVCTDKSASHCYSKTNLDTHAKVSHKAAQLDYMFSRK
jgi:hypothetical protein